MGYVKQETYATTKTSKTKLRRGHFLPANVSTHNVDNHETDHDNEYHDHEHNNHDTSDNNDTAASCDNTGCHQVYAPSSRQCGTNQGGQIMKKSTSMEELEIIRSLFESFNKSELNRTEAYQILIYLQHSMIDLLHIWHSLLILPFISLLCNLNSLLTTYLFTLNF